MSLQAVLTQLSGVEPAASGYKADCPLQNGRPHKVSITSGPNGEVFFSCARRCSKNKIAEALQDKVAHPFNGIHISSESRAEEAKMSNAAVDIARRPRILDYFVSVLASMGLAGEELAAKLLYLLLTTRLFDSPVSGIVKGLSSAGKSRVVADVLKFFPDDASYQWSSMSPKALAYDNENIAHRMIVMYEATPLKDTDAAYFHRSLISEGKVKHMTVERVKGRQVIRKVERDGPTGLISTTTETSLDPELETRCLSIPIDDSPRQTRNVLLATAREANRKAPPVNLERWIEFQKWLAKAEHRVQIPYAETLAQKIDPTAIRLRRDFSKVLTLIKAHAVLHQQNRERDPDGEIIATVEDYEVVRGLVNDLLSGVVGASISPTVAETVEAVRDALPHTEEDAVTIEELAQRLGLDPTTTGRRIQDALAKGYVINLEARRQRPARLQLGKPLPRGAQVLPGAAELTTKEKHSNEIA